MRLYRVVIILICEKLNFFLMKFVDLLPKDVHVSMVKILSQPAMNVLTLMKVFFCVIVLKFV